MVNFEIPHNLVHNDIVVLKGFANNIYNTSYKVLIQDNNVILQPLNLIPITTLTDNLGYISSVYNNGLNGVFFIEDEEDNKLSYTFDSSLYNVVNNI